MISFNSHSTDDFNRLPWCGLFLFGLGLIACTRDAEDEPFYSPPEERIRAESTIEVAEESCERWQTLRSTFVAGPHEAGVTELQQQLLLFGFEEIRIDPVAPTVDEVLHHITASVRGLHRDTLLVLSLSPPDDEANLASLLSLAKYWTAFADPDRPPALTVRFAVLPSPRSGEPSIEQVLANYIVQRPRVMAQTRAVLVLEPSSSSDRLWTNRPELTSLLSGAATLEQIEVHDLGSESVTRTGLSSSINRLNIPMVTGNFGLSPTPVDTQTEGRVERCSTEITTAIDQRSSLLQAVFSTLFEGMSRKLESSDSESIIPSVATVDAESLQ